MRDVEDHTLIVLLVAVSVAFAWILWPFYGAILWATVLAIVFAPLYRWLSSAMGQHRSLAAIASVLIILTLVILPLTLTAASLLQEATNLYETISLARWISASSFNRSSTPCRPGRPTSSIASA